MTDTTTPGGRTAPIPDAEFQREFEAWLNSMDTVDAARMLQVLTTNPSWLGALRAERVYMLTRGHTYDHVAALLGVGANAVNKAVTAHNRRTQPPTSERAL